MIFWIVISVLFGPGAIMLLLGILSLPKLIPNALDRLFWAVTDLQQPPPWVRYITGSSFSYRRFALWIWLTGPAIAVCWVAHRIWSCLCSMRGHKFDKTYGTLSDAGNPVYYCSSCFRWKSGRGFYS